jgi:hypothetical protein
VQEQRPTRRSLAEELELHAPADSLTHPITGPNPAAASTPPAGPTGPPASVRVAGAGGVIAVLVAVDQALQAQGKTLADLTINSGPLAGALVANWPIVAVFAWAAWSLHSKWAAHVTWTRDRARVQDEASARQVRAILKVAAKVEGLETSFVAAQRETSDLRQQVQRIEVDVQSLRRDLERDRR